MKPKVLLIEDEANLVELVRVNLESAGYAVDAAGNGPEGLAKLASLKPDIVILDIHMPGMDGWEVCRRIRQAPAGRRVPVIILSASSQRADMEKAGSSGADLFLAKPFDPEMLVKSVCALLQDRKEDA